VLSREALNIQVCLENPITGIGKYCENEYCESTFLRGYQFPWFG
jgi:hypothetical protein